MVIGIALDRFNPHIMIGFEIYINDNEPIAAISDSLVTAIISVGYHKGEDFIYIGGKDSKSYHLVWLEKKLKIGDKIKIRVTEIDAASSLQKRYPSDRKQMKEEYYDLKKQLEDKSLL